MIRAGKRCYPVGDADGAPRPPHCRGGRGPRPYDEYFTTQP
jgi:hypothetical protein